MAAITDAEWGRIYAFIWKKYQDKDASYKELFEKDPRAAIEKIKLEITPPIKGTEILKIENNPGLTSDELDEIIQGKTIAFFQVRLCC